MTYARHAARSQIDFVSKGILAIAAVGWGLFAWSVLSSGSDEQAEIAHLRQLVETVTAKHTKVVQEQEQIIQASGDLEHLRKAIAAATQEIQRLDAMRAQISTAIDQTHPQLVAAAARPRSGSDSMTTGSIAPTPVSKEQIRTAQEALTDFGYGNLEADGLFGPSTRKAIEAFEQAKGLPVTGKLGPATLQALRAHTASAVE
jgi:murein L,D-transpeptidase YcbB/YkuD